MHSSCEHPQDPHSWSPSRKHHRKFINIFESQNNPVILSLFCSFASFFWYPPKPIPTLVGSNQQLCQGIKILLRGAALVDLNDGVQGLQGTHWGTNLSHQVQRMPPGLASYPRLDWDAKVGIAGGMDHQNINSFVKVAWALISTSQDAVGTLHQPMISLDLDGHGLMHVLELHHLEAASHS